MVKSAGPLECWYHEVKPINDENIIVPETPSNIHRNWGR